ncbi:MAG: hypothetical protein HY855_15580 [Burkholderiales bacterium]|nr:hypothetical protein [Burkholderiales bacterium]
MHVVQQWFNLAAAACEHALLASTALRRLVGIGLCSERVLAATIGAPSSTYNRDKKLDSALHQTCRAKQNFFGMKMHLGWTARPAWHRARGSRPPTLTPGPRCPSVFMGKNAMSGATAPTPRSRA